MLITGSFILSLLAKSKSIQLQRYEQRGSPEYIKQIIAIGGGPRMGSIMEKYARFTFKNLQHRKKGEKDYDHTVVLPTMNYKIEQKSSGHWNNEYKWQHIKEKNNWDALLLCGIDYHDIHFWVMTRSVFNELLLQGKITNQGDKSGKSSEGLWFNYLDVKDLLITIHTDEELETAISNR